MRSLKRLASSLAVFASAALVVACNCDNCDNNTSPSACRTTPTLSPSSGTLTIGASLTVTTSVDAGCAAPIVENLTPSIIRVDATPLPIVVTALAPGAGRIQVLAAADTTLRATGTFTVVVPGSAR